MEFPDDKKLPSSLNGTPASEKDIAKLEKQAKSLADNRLEETYHEHQLANDDGGIITFRTDSHEWETTEMTDEAPTHASLTIAQGYPKNILFWIGFDAANQIEDVPVADQHKMPAVLALITGSRAERYHTDDELALLNYVEMIAGGVLLRKGNIKFDRHTTVQTESGEQMHAADAIRRVIDDETDYGIAARQYSEPLPDGNNLTVITRKIVGSLWRDDGADVPAIEVLLQSPLRDGGNRPGLVEYRFRKFQDGRRSLESRPDPINREDHNTGNVSEIATIPGQDDVNHLSYAIFNAHMQTITT